MLNRRQLLLSTPAWATALSTPAFAHTKRAIIDRDNNWNPARSFLIANMNTGHILKSYNDNKPIYPASITKLMTMEIALTCLKEQLLTPDEYLTMTPYSSRKSPTHLGLKPGERIRLIEAFKAVTVHSCNDIASLIAERIAGSEAGFVELMNKRAKSFNMNNTVFYNATGLPDQKNISTAYDISLLTSNIMIKHPDKIWLFGLPSWTWNDRTYENSNHLMGHYTGMDFCKTGYIHASGYNLVASVSRGDTRYLGVITGCHTPRERDILMTNIMDRVFQA